MYIYTDGSFRNAKHCWAFLAYENKIVHADSGVVHYNKASRNIVGELVAVIAGAYWAFSNGVQDITFCFDYEGVEKFYTGEYRAKTELTQKYVSLMRYISNFVKLNFKKVKGHFDPWNVVVDNMCRTAEKTNTSIDLNSFYRNVMERLNATSLERIGTYV